MAQTSNLQAKQDEDGGGTEDQKSPKAEDERKRRNKEESSSNVQADAQQDTTCTGKKAKGKKLRSADALDPSTGACKQEDEGGAGEHEEDAHEEKPKARKKKKHKDACGVEEMTGRTGDETAAAAEDGKEEVGVREGGQDEEAEEGKAQKKKKRKRKQLDEAVEAAQEVETNADGGGNGAGDCEEVQEPTERSKRKKRKSIVEEEPAEVKEEEQGVTEPVQDDPDQKKKKKKKRSAQAVDVDAEGGDIAGAGGADGLEAVGTAGNDDVAEGEEPKRRKKNKANKASTEEVEKQETEEEAACVKVCVANLPTSMGKGHIWKLFEDCGEIEDVFLLKDWWTGASRGVCFITFSDAKASHLALQRDGEDHLGQALRVNLALDRQKGKGSDKGSGGPKGWGKAAGRGEGGDKGSGSPKGWGKVAGRGEGGGKGKGKDKGKGKAPPAMFALNDKPAGCVGILLRGLSYAVTEADLKECFANCGSGPSRVRLLVDADGTSKGKAFLDFANEAAVDEAIKLTGTKLKGRKLCVEYSRPREQ
mmetsp:Transcript_129357/g.314273  ORF Transcript_129357/g.314273 Transcript_129357/m.314273 type:complete len:534 (+) Transcript_129357:74-1675(+)